MKKTIQTLYWNIAPVLPFLFIALLACSLGWKLISPESFVSIGRIALGVPTVLVFMLIPLQILIPPDFSSWWYRRMVTKNLALLEKNGLTREQYLASLPDDMMIQSIVKAELGIGENR